MTVGVPTEIKDHEMRVAITPAGVLTLVRGGHTVCVQSGAGEASGIADPDLRAAGAILVPSPEEVYERADLILKVKEPLAPEYALLRPGQVLFTYLHLASSRELTEALLASGVIAIGYETVQSPDGSLPLLIPMSEVAGRLAVLMGAHYLSSYHHGRGILLSGVPGVPPADVAIVGCGIVGANAAKIAAGSGASVTVLDRSQPRLRYIDDVYHGNVITVVSNPYTLERAVAYADLLIGAVLIPGAAAPKLITEEMVAQMKPGAVIVDVDIDQGGCVETMRPTTHSDPVFLAHDVVHYGVTNMPAAVPRTATWALTNATLPYVAKIAQLGWTEAGRQDPALAKGLQIINGRLVHQAVAESLDLPYTPAQELI